MLARGISIGILSVELLAALANFGIQFPGTNTQNYPRGTEDAASMIRYMKERERYNLFYRTETTHSQTLNDGALNGYNGISAFTSSANVKTTLFMKALGYGAKNTYNRYCFEESAPTANLFLGIKYMLEREGRDRDNSSFHQVHSFGSVALLENNFYLPLGFLTEPELADLDFSQGDDSFGFQNDLIAAATGEDLPLWHLISEGSLEISSDTVTIESQSGIGECTYLGGDEDGNLHFSYVADRKGFCAIHLDFPKRNHFHVNINGVEVMREKISLPQMLAIGDVVPGDVVEIVIGIDSKEHSTVEATAAILDMDRMQEAYDILAANQLNLTSFRSDLVEGYIECDRDGLLYTSIPQNGNWQVIVDSRPGEQTLVGDCMLAIPLTEGAHMITLRYRNPAFSIGWKVTVLCIGILAALAYRQKKKKTK